MNQEEVTPVRIKDKEIDLKRDYIHDILSTKNFPIVLLDPLWHSAKERIKSTVIDRAEKELKELLKEQARLNTDYKEYQAMKQNFLKKILVLSEQVQVKGENRAFAELDKLQLSVRGINQKIEEIEARLETVEDDIQDKNKEMISEMIAVGYGYIDVYKERSQKLEEEFTQLRLTMLKKTAQKKESEAFLKDIYNYLHSIIGREQIEVIDRTLGEKK